MYYPDEVIDEVRSRSDIVDVISQTVKLTRKGNYYFGLCPFHSEKTPSFSVSPSKQVYHCFGCGAGGNVISYVMQYENFGFQEAVRYLAERAGITLPEQSETPEERANRDRRALLLEINKEAATFYYYQLRSPGGSQGLSYLKGRELSEETIRSFGLGYAGKYSNSLYQYLKSKSKAYTDEVLKESGLFHFDEKRGMNDLFWNRVMFPIMDINHRVIGFGGRVMGDAKPKYLNSPETKVFDKSRNLYGLHVARRTREPYLIVCEGYMDVIAMHQAGFTNAVASLGTALTPQHCLLLKRFTSDVILSYDSDAAGVKAALRAIPMLRQAGITARVLHLSPYKDPDEFMKAEGKEAFRTRLEEAENSFFFEVFVLEQSYRMSDPEGRTRFFMACAKKIAAFELEVERENYIQALAEKYHVSFEGLRSMVLRELMRGAPDQPPAINLEESLPEAPVRRPGTGRKKEDGQLRTERMLLSWLTEDPSFYEILKSYLSPEDFSDPLHQEVAGMLFAQCEANAPDPAGLISRFPEEEKQREAAAIINAPLPSLGEEEKKKAMKESIRKVAEAALQRKNDTLDATDLTTLKEILDRKRRLQNLTGA